MDQAAFINQDSYDGNGNVIGYVDMATGTKSATYDYNTFGETIEGVGLASITKRFRFSTKYTDDETGLLYYGFRYYSPVQGRWLSRDPIEEQGGTNLSLFGRNDPIRFVDNNGRNVIVIPAIIGAIVVAVTLPCIPVVGSIAYRVDYPPSPPHNGIPTPHSHKFEMNQAPPSKGCFCFWVEILKHPLPGILGPPITPAAGGGLAP